MKKLDALLNEIQHGIRELATERVAMPARALIQRRRLRDEFFPAGLFADPAWDILLELVAARHEGVRVPVSALCSAAAVPTTTALRWVSTLAERGLIIREQDPSDRRRVFVSLSDTGWSAMRSYFERVGTVI